MRRTGSPEAIAVLALLGVIAGARVETAEAKPPPPLRGPIAKLGTRTVEAVDIQWAAKALGVEPPQGMTPRAWRRTLLDRCVDREMLALEAERRGLFQDPEVLRGVTSREFDLLMGSTQEKVLQPHIVPTRAEFDSIKAAGRYRVFDLHYILIRDEQPWERLKLAERVTERARSGARFDSLAKIYSGHPPTAMGGGHYGPIQVRELESQAQDSIQTAKPGDVFGPYPSLYGHQIYKFGGWIEVGDSTLMHVLVEERGNQLFSNYYAQVFQKYHMTSDTTNAKRAMALFERESPDSILASLQPDGMFPGTGVYPPIGLIAHADGTRVTIADIIRVASPVGSKEHIHVHSVPEMAALAGRAALHDLIVRDARDRGLDKEPAMARRLRLCRDEVATRTMVTRARPSDPDAEALRAYIEKNPSRYQRPAARVARVAMFASADSARNVLRAWNGVGFPSDSVLKRMSLRVRKNARPGEVFPTQVASVAIPETSTDPLSLSLRTLSPGQFAPVTETVQGWAVAMVTGHEGAAALSPQEATPIALDDWRKEKENQWVTDLLERLRAKTPVTVIPGRLEAVRLEREKPTTSASRKRAAQ
jgi:hypothetical protein